MKLKQHFIFLGLLIFTSFSHAMFNLNSDGIKELQPVAENIGDKATANLNLPQTALHLQHLGKEAAQRLIEAAQKLQHITITTQSTIHITCDPKTYALLADMWSFIKDRGPRISSGLLLMTAGLVMVVDSAKRLAESNGDKLLWKTVETTVGIILAGSGLYLVLG